MNKPNIFKRIKNFLIALYSHIKDGFQKVSKKEKQRRITICDSCEFKNSKNECSVCGCYLPLKTSWKDQSCPENKW